MLFGDIFLNEYNPLFIVHLSFNIYQDYFTILLYHFCDMNLKFAIAISELLSIT